MNRRLALGVVTVAIAGFAFAPATANAAVCAAGQTEQSTYPPCTSGISDRTAFPGETETVSVPSGTFTPDETVEYGVRSNYQKLGTTTAAANGSASATFAVPMNLEAGQHEVVFTGLTSHKEADVAFTVIPASSSAPSGSSSAPSGLTGSSGSSGASSDSLPRTGSTGVIPMTAASIGLVLLGGGVIVVARRRHDRSLSTSR